MTNRVASIIAEIGMDSSKFNTGARNLTNDIKNLAKDMGSLGGVIGIAGAALAAIAYEMHEAEKAAVESARADAKLQAVLDSTGGAIGKTATRLDDLANQISRATGLDDELVKSSEAVLLTFTRIGGDIFPATMLAAADMAAVLGGDLQGSIVQVGKAMNDFSGYTALKRAGVSLTEEQIKQIAHFKETNDLAGYQSLILSELGTEFGGAAGKINQAGDGSENLKVSMGNLQEAIGKGLIPQQRAWNKLLTETADEMEKVVTVNNDYNDKLNDLGIVRVRGAVYMKDGIRLSKQEADQLVENAQVARIVDDTLKDMANSQDGLGKSVVLTDAQLEQQAEDIKTLTEYNKGLLSITASFQSVEEDYQQSNKSITKERMELEAERSLKLSQGYQESGSVIKELDAKLAENSEKAKENASEHEEAGRRIVLGLLEQRLAVDGLDTKETEYLLKKGVEWGIYSDTVVQEMRDAVLEAQTLSSSINDIPGSKDIYITTHYLDIRNEKEYMRNEGAGHANGADFIVPPGYNNDSYPMRVQSGEHVQVTPAGQASSEMSQLLREIRRLPVAIRDTMLQAAQ